MHQQFVLCAGARIVLVYWMRTCVLDVYLCAGCGQQTELQRSVPAHGLAEVCAVPDEGISERNKVCPIKVIKSNCTGCLSADISALMPQMELIQPRRLVHLSLSEAIYTNVWIHFSCCSAHLGLLFCAVLSRSVLFLPVQVCTPPLPTACGEDEILLQPPRSPRPGAETLVPEREADSALVHSSCSGSASERCGRQVGPHTWLCGEARSRL